MAKGPIPESLGVAINKPLLQHLQLVLVNSPRGDLLQTSGGALQSANGVIWAVGRCPGFQIDNRISGEFFHGFEDKNLIKFDYVHLDRVLFL